MGNYYRVYVWSCLIDYPDVRAFYTNVVQAGRSLHFSGGEIIDNFWTKNS